MTGKRKVWAEYSKEEENNQSQSSHLQLVEHRSIDQSAASYMLVATACTRIYTANVSNEELTNTRQQGMNTTP